MRDEIDPKKVFKQKPDMLGGRIKSSNERIPNATDEDFQQHVMGMVAFLSGQKDIEGAGTYTMTPLERNNTVIQNLVREIAQGTKPEDLRLELDAVIWQSTPKDWQEDPNYFSAVGLLFATLRNDGGLFGRLMTGLPSQSSVAAAQAKR